MASTSMPLLSPRRITTCSRTRSTTTPGSAAEDSPGSCHRFRVIHPYHPLFGREFDLVDVRVQGTGGNRAYFFGDGGDQESIPIGWTDRAAEDPFVVVSAGRAHFRIEDLLRLSSLIESLTSPPPGDAAQGRGGVK